MSGEIKTREELLKIYEDVGPHAVEGRWWVIQNGKMFHVRLDGSRAYEPTHDWVGDYDDEGSAPARDGDHRFVMGDDGLELLPAAIK